MRQDPLADAHPDLAERMLAALGHPCPVCRSILTLLLRRVHDCAAVECVAADSGCGTRWKLARQLMRHGFPNLQILKDWLRLLVVVSKFESSGQALVAQAYGAGVEPSVLHRCIRRRTGWPWSVVRTYGLTHWLRAFAGSVGVGVRCATIDCSAPHAPKAFPPRAP